MAKGNQQTLGQGRDDTYPRLLGGDPALDYVNTIEGPRSAAPEEFLHGYGDLARWSYHASLLDARGRDRLADVAARRPEAAAATFSRALDLRVALTEIFRAVARGEAPPDSALARLQREYGAALAHARLALREGQCDWEWAGDDDELDRPLWAIARAAVDLLTTGELSRIKECPGAGDCGWLFYDTSKNGSRRWCSMEGCGSRVKMRHHYARRRAADGSQPA